MLFKFDFEFVILGWCVGHTFPSCLALIRIASRLRVTGSVSLPLPPSCSSLLSRWPMAVAAFSRLHSTLTAQPRLLRHLRRSVHSSLQQKTSLDKVPPLQWRGRLSTQGTQPQPTSPPLLGKLLLHHGSAYAVGGTAAMPDSANDATQVPASAPAPTPKATTTIGSKLLSAYPHLLFKAMPLVMVVALPRLGCVITTIQVSVSFASVLEWTGSNCVMNALLRTVLSDM